jgi:CheY-like chemotaxis protein
MSTTSSGANHRILVVDDTPANIQSLAAILKEKGYQISVYWPAFRPTSSCLMS